MKRLVALAIVAAAVVAMGVPTPRRTAGAGASITRGRPAAKPAADGEEPVDPLSLKVTIDQFPRLGRQSTLPAPSVAGGSILGRCYTKPRSWIVLEAKYQTYAKFHDQLTFTWHVLLDSKSATENKGNRLGLPPYSYFTQSVTYQNIPQGSHAASVCLHPSYLELYGEPKAIGIVITNAKGEVIAGDCESEIKGVPTHPKSLDEAFWNNNDIMNANQANGDPMVARRQGLVDRSKTIWALVNPNDYEMVVQ